MIKLQILFLLLSATASFASFPDFDDNDIVDFTDFLLFVEKFGTVQGDIHFDVKFDLDSDGAIGFSDFLLFAKDFGKKSPHLAYNIEIIFTDEVLSSRQKSIVMRTARRWEEVIGRDVEDLVYDQTTTTIRREGNVTVTITTHNMLRVYGHEFPDGVDDMVIFVETEDIPGRVLGRGGSITFRDSIYKTDLPHFGTVTLSHSLLNEYSEENLYSTTLHEIGHILGIGAVPFEGLCVADSLLGSYFPGKKAVGAFNRVGGAGYPYGKVPVEADLSHWRHDVFGYELMNPYHENRSPLSLVTIQALADLGYPVDVSKADFYTLPSNQ